MTLPSITLTLSLILIRNETEKVHTTSVLKKALAD
jgi:hypothetical protein